MKKKKIEKIINDFNYDIDKNEKLDNGDKYKICDLYLNVKRNIIIKIINNFFYFFFLINMIYFFSIFFW